MKQINSYDEYHANRLKGLEEAVAENSKGEEQEQPLFDTVASEKADSEKQAPPAGEAP